jgi:glycosyltransferase involved in cell wall biosynthesis
MISIFTAVMNREERMAETLNNWLQFNWFDEVVIVDWSSAVPFEYADKRVKIHRVEGEQNWILSQAYNLSAQLTKGDILVKMDADYRIKDCFYSNIFPIPDGHYFHGTWKGRWMEDPSIDDNNKYLNGFVTLRREDFFKVNGYHEGITYYGWDDTDLYSRLDKHLEPLIVKPEHGIWHEPHDDNLRVANQQEKLLIEQKESYWHENKKLAEEQHWSIDNKMQEWECVNGVFIRQ